MLCSRVRARLVVPDQRFTVKARVQRHPLRSHPAIPPPPGLRLDARVLPGADPLRPLHLCFELHGDLDAVRLPGEGAEGRVQGARTDGLWRHSCFEAFVSAVLSPTPATVDEAGGGREPYVEFNFAPGGDWAVYRFDGYRAGMRPEPVTSEPTILLRREAQCLQIEVAAAWPLPLPGALPAAGESPDVPVWRGRLGLAAVVETADGGLSYWALHHPAARADFHDPAGFVLGIEVKQ